MKRLRYLTGLLAMGGCLLGIVVMVWGYYGYRPSVETLAEGKQRLPETPPDVVTTLPPGVSFERCLTLTPAEVLSYAFQADQPVVFDVHYHRGVRMVYAQQRRTASSEAGTYHATSAREYCLTWHNTGQEAIRLSWRYAAQTQSEISH